MLYKSSSYLGLIAELASLLLNVRLFFRGCQILTVIFNCSSFWSVLCVEIKQQTESLNLFQASGRPH